MTNRITSWLCNSPNILALDIGSRYMKVMQLEQSGGLPTLHGAAIGPVPDGTIDDGFIINKPAVASALRKMLDQHNIKGSRVYMATGGHSIILRWIEMPAMPENDLRKAIKHEAHKHLPLPVERCELDFMILNSRTEGKVRILLIATPLTLIESRLETAKLAGLKPIGMDVEPLAVLRALEYHRTRSELAWDKHPQSFLMFGSAGTDFYVIKNSNLEFFQRIPIGGSNLARIIAEGLNLDPTETDEYDLIRRVLFDQNGRVAVQDAPDDLASKLESEVARLDQEIKRAYSCYQSLFPEGSYEGTLTYVSMGGGLAAIDGFRDYIADKLNLTVDIADPLAKIGVRNMSGSSELLNGRRTSFIVSAGLFLKQVEK